MINGLICVLVAVGIATIYKGSDAINAMQGEFGIVAATLALIEALFVCPSAAGTPLPTFTCC